MIARLRGQPQKLRQLRPICPRAWKARWPAPWTRTPTPLQHRAELAAALTASHSSGFLSKIKEKLNKRFPAFDPPEYVEWKPDPALVRGFRETIERKSRARRRRGSPPGDDQARPVRRTAARAAARHPAQAVGAQGVISKAWLGTGEEATTVGPYTRSSGGRTWSHP